MMNNKLIEVGYWKSDDEPNYPDPTTVGKIDPEIKKIVLDYLSKGKLNDRWKGYSYCRFNCGINDSDMGSTDYTDGVYVWPVGLTHYVGTHNVNLPQHFIDHILKNNQSP